MTSPQNPSRPSGLAAPKDRQGVKTLFATVSLAATLGGWAMLAAGNGAVKATRVSTAVAPRDVAAVELELPPLPTLVPPSSGLVLPTQQPTVSQPAPQPTLRSVNQPPPQRVVHVGGGGGGDSGQGPAPAAQTGSSR